MIKEKAYAKVNLALDIVGKRDDGYHDLKMIMMPIELHDILTFEKADQIELISNLEIEDNAIVKAALLLQKAYQIKTGAKITLDKKIPIGAGLAGGSADIAATLRGLNLLWKLNLSLEDLSDIALKLGSDTLFCLYNQTAFVHGRGEHLLFVKTPPIENIYLFISRTQVSTKKVFSEYQIEKRKDRFDSLFKLYINEKFNSFFKKTFNQLTTTTLNIYPELKKLNQQLKKLRIPYLMSGSGSTFYIASFYKNDKKISAKINKNNLDYVQTKPKN